MNGYTAKELLGAVKNPCKIIKHLGGKGYFKWIPDEQYLRLCYRGAFGKKLNLENPATFNEKLQWLKLYDRKRIYTTMADKYAVKQFVAEEIGDRYLIPTFGVWDSFDEIDFDTLPNQFVLKCTHDSGGVVICRDKAAFDYPQAKAKLEKCLKRDFFYVGREWGYRDIKPRIIAEEYLNDMDSGDSVDYKLMTFNGKVKCTFVCSGRHSEQGLCITVMDDEWNRIPVKRPTHPVCSEPVAMPATYPTMVELAEKFGRDIPFLRVDFYEIAGKLYFGEFTFYPSNGFESFQPESFDDEMGNWLMLPQKTIG